MFLSDRDLQFAIASGQLIVRPQPAGYGTTSIDLHLDAVDRARVWNSDAFVAQQAATSPDLPVLGVGSFDYRRFGAEFYAPVPEDDGGKVFRRGEQVILRPGGFLLWQTREVVGTPEQDPRLICFIDGKSKIARTGLLVHLTAPTVHAGWWGNVTLEIANLGPFNIGLKEGDAIAQIVVAVISSPPLGRAGTTTAVGQREVSGGSPAAPPTQ
jgi:dCTP deaminase